MARKRSRLRPPRNPFPSVRYGPEGAVATFDREEDVPEGWMDHPSKVQEAAQGSSETGGDSEPGEEDDSQAEGSQGDPWAAHVTGADSSEGEDDDLPPEPVKQTPKTKTKKLKNR